MMNTRGIFLISVVVLAHLAYVAAAGYGFHCQDVWTSASSNNDVVKCITNTDRLKKVAGNYVLPALCILFLVVTIFAFPIIFLCCVCCQCCCECCKEVPKERREQSRSSRNNLIILMVILLGICATILALMISGAAQFLPGVTDIFPNFDHAVRDYLTNLTDALVAVGTDPQTGNLTEPMTPDNINMIRDAINSMGNTTESYHGQAITYSNLVAKIAYGVAVLPLFFMIFTFLFSLCNCRKCCPSCLTCIYWLVGIIFSIIGFILLLLGSIFGDLCAEIDLQTARAPGMMQWYVVPKCNDAVNFTKILTTVSDFEAKMAAQACQKFSEYCDATSTYNAGTPKKAWVCSLNPLDSQASSIAGQDCPDLGVAYNKLANAAAKTSMPACTGCVFKDCPQVCTSTGLDGGTIKNASTDAMKLLNMGYRLHNAVAIVRPLMDCNNLIDRGLMILKSCPNIRDGLIKIGVSFFLTLIAIVFGWIIMFRGQKVWFSKEEYEEGELANQEMRVMDGGNPNPMDPPKNAWTNREADDVKQVPS